jgi:tRNA (guanine26-N2/guanine27-N2)-dimethyltransferase
MRRYFATPKNTGYHTEVGLRILMGTMAKELVKYDIGMEPLVSFARSHYVRSHVRVLHGAPDAERTMAEIGFVLQCPECLYRAEQKGSLLPSHHICPYCGAVTEPVGPMWMGRLSDKAVVRGMLDLLPEMALGTSRAMEKLLGMILEEPDTASFYDYHVISRSLRVSPPPMDALIEELRALGCEAARTHLWPTGIKTTAPLNVLEERIRGWFT